MLYIGSLRLWFLPFLHGTASSLQRFILNKTQQHPRTLVKPLGRCDHDKSDPIPHLRHPPHHPLPPAHPPNPANTPALPRNISRHTPNRTSTLSFIYSFQLTDLLAVLADPLVAPRDIRRLLPLLPRPRLGPVP